MRGQKKPTALHVLHGTDRPEVRGLNEPKPAIDAEYKPTFKLNKDCMEVWNFLIDSTITLGLLTHNDVHSFTQYCHATGMYKKITEQIGEDHVLVNENSGVHYTNPLCGVAFNYLKISTDLGSKFGMTPVARTRIAVQPLEKKGTFQNLKKTS
jgi:P27 family predicted phage terminase small subunit